MKAIIADSNENIDHINEMIKQGHKIDLIGKNSNGIIVHFKDDECIIHNWDFDRTVCFKCGIKHPDNGK